jgi:hypothetical protein
MDESIEHKAQILTDIVAYPFEFKGYLPATDTIASVYVGVSPVGPTEVSSQRTIAVQTVWLTIDVSAATAGEEYFVLCQVTSSSGKRKSLYLMIHVLAQDVGVAMPFSTPIFASTYLAALVQPGDTSNPVATVIGNNFVLGAPVWTRTVQGTYRGVLAGAFPAGKTVVRAWVVKGQILDESDADLKWIDVDTVELRVVDLSNNLVDGFSPCYVEINVLL